MLVLGEMTALPEATGTVTDVNEPAAGVVEPMAGG
jgi:hypothetical protein